jgi:hypothetical protein
MSTQALVVNQLCLSICVQDQRAITERAVASPGIQIVKQWTCGFPRLIEIILGSLRCFHAICWQDRIPAMPCLVGSHLISPILRLYIDHEWVLEPRMLRCMVILQF